ncbi:complement C1q-like protein 2 [Cheilinus undulatus]|uniref:complement C1q-like protein 2 n=1 Tax=Cheilinus undulatus TaxID=241271 RepID=UPI001BD24730|nr:complement C1q-like protein 2 [Cheilinus undulatus]
MCCEFGDLKAKIAALETKLQDSENQIAALKSKEGKKLAFSAEVGPRGAVGPFDSETTLVYQTVITNEGNAYNSSTGIFSAPYDGIYYFTIFHHAGGGPGTELFLYKNDQRVVQTQDHPAVHETAHNGGNAVFLQLNQGDQVYVRMGPNQHVWGSGLHTTFSGFLVDM